MKWSITKALFKFCTTSHLFKFFRQRYNKQQLIDLNNVVKIRGKIRTIKLSTAFLKACIAKKLAPKFITSRIKNAKIRHSPTIERVFLTDEISANESKLVKTTLQEAIGQCSKVFVVFRLDSFLQIFGRDRNTQKRPNSSQALFQPQLDEEAAFWYSSFRNRK